MKNSSTIASEGPNKVLAEALRLAASGVPVFPCKADKSPRVSGGFKVASKDEGQISQWWRKWPNALIGVPTGAPSGLTGVDVDPVGKIWLELNRDRLLPSVVHKSPRGEHFLFEHVEGMRSRANAPVNGVDIRAEGGYVIWWPAHDHTFTGEPGSVGPMPGWLRDDLMSTETPATLDCADDQSASTASNHWLSTLPEWSRRLIQLGDTDNRYASKSEAIAAAERALIDAGASDDQIVSTMLAPENRISIAVRAHSTQPEEFLRRDIARIRHKARKAAPQSECTFSVESWAEMRDRPPIEWRVGSLLPQRGVALVYGESGIGKSHLALSLGVAMARGEDWAGLIIDAAPVLYVPTEGEVRDRLRATEAHIGLTAPYPPFVRLTSAPALDDVAKCDALAQFAREQGYRVVIVDVLADSLGAAEENSASDMRTVLSNVKRLAKTIDGLVILVHHSGKSGTSERGSSALRGAATTVLRLERAGTRLKLIVEKMRDASPLEPMYLRLLPVEFEGGSSVVLVSADAPSQDIPETVVKSLRILHECGGNTGMKFSRWRDSCTHVSPSSFKGNRNQSGHIRRLEDAGLVEVIGTRGNRGTLYRPTAAARKRFRLSELGDLPANGLEIEQAIPEGPTGQSRANQPNSLTGNRDGLNPHSKGLARSPTEPQAGDSP
ncbi:MAG: AAA family ATPase [Proteobacteria bacterium]|nr:AAA family ATPase [Pseudomonadota bacterium]